MRNKFVKIENSHNIKTIALAGNPNVGKSTVFNKITGLNQHTGNWPGKTVTSTSGKYTYKEDVFKLVDLPGTYSLNSNSSEEEIARDFIYFSQCDCIVVVADATCLERNLNLVLQMIETGKKIILCLNLMDQAKNKKISIDLKKLSYILQIPVIATSARKNIGLKKLKEQIYNLSFKKQKENKLKITYNSKIEQAINIIEPYVSKVTSKNLNSRCVCLKLLENDNSFNKAFCQYLGLDIFLQSEFKEKLAEANLILKNAWIDSENLKDEIVSAIFKKSEEICKQCVKFENPKYALRDRKIDKILTSKGSGTIFMILLLAFVFWITIVAANYPSELLSKLLFKGQDKLEMFLNFLSLPNFWVELLADGIYRTVAWVVSVMLPPMAIFFPLFTIIEDSGYLPRIAFNLDSFFKKSGSNGKQALTMCMGFGCNACGVMGCRIINSKREKLIAMITNCLVPCNGKFPTLIAIISMFFIAGSLNAINSIFSATILILVIIFCVFVTLLISKFLSKTFLKGMPSSFILELPPYRMPQIGKVIIRSIFDRTLFVLARALAVAAPAGLIIWLMSNILIDEKSLLLYCSSYLEPFAKLLGLDGIILFAFILAFPANEIVIPIILMAYLSTSSITEYSSLSELKNILVNNGWTINTAISFMIFSLFHFPCGTTCLTIKKESGKLKWALLSFILPTILGITLCILFNSLTCIFT